MIIEHNLNGLFYPILDIIFAYKNTDKIASFVYDYHKFYIINLWQLFFFALKKYTTSLLNN